MGLTFACDEGDELANTLLHAFLSFLCYLCIVWQGVLHDSSDWSKVANVSINIIKLVSLLGP